MNKTYQALLYPLPEYPLNDIVAIGRRKLRSARDTIASASFEEFVAVIDDYDPTSVVECFHLDRETNCFRVRPHGWGKFTEVQITKGLAYFLSEEDAKHTPQRCIAFLKGLGIQDVDASSGFSVKAEHLADQNTRIDLLLEWTDGSHSNRGAIVEAKFWHRLTSGQLAGYRKYATDRLGLNGTNLALIVLSPTETARQAKELNRNRNWIAVTWLELILRFDRHIGPRWDSDDFRRFRRTIIHQSNGA